MISDQNISNTGIFTGFSTKIAAILDFCYFASNSGGISHDLIQRIFKSI
jgi:hypothetical protein